MAKRTDEWRPRHELDDQPPDQEIIHEEKTFSRGQQFIRQLNPLTGGVVKFEVPVKIQLPSETHPGSGYVYSRLAYIKASSVREAFKLLPQFMAKEEVIAKNAQKKADHKIIDPGFGLFGPTP